MTTNRIAWPKKLEWSEQNRDKLRRNGRREIVAHKQVDHQPLLETVSPARRPASDFHKQQTEEKTPKLRHTNTPPEAHKQPEVAHTLCPEQKARD